MFLKILLNFLLIILDNCFVIQARTSLKASDVIFYRVNVVVDNMFSDVAWVQDCLK